MALREIEIPGSFPGSTIYNLRKIRREARYKEKDQKEVLGERYVLRELKGLIQLETHDHTTRGVGTWEAG